MSLTRSERELGWAELHCPEHGFLVATSARAVVRCRCGKAAAPPGRVARRAAAPEALSRSTRRRASKVQETAAPRGA